MPPFAFNFIIPFEDYHSLFLAEAGQSATELCGKLCSVRSCKCFTKMVLSQQCYIDTYVSIKQIIGSNQQFTLFLICQYRSMDCRLRDWLIMRTDMDTECSVTFLSSIPCLFYFSWLDSTWCTEWRAVCAGERERAQPILDK